MKKIRNVIFVILSFIITFVVSTPVRAMEISPYVIAEPDYELLIVATSSGQGSSINTSGHVFLIFRNPTSTAVTIGVKSVPSGGSITFGTWQGSPMHDGVWYNLESYLIAKGGYGTDTRYYLSMSITPSQIGTINNFIANNDAWTLTNNCSSFGSGLWNSVSGSSMKVDPGLIDTPSNVVSSIRSKSGYKTNPSIQYPPTTGTNTSVGYKSGSSIYYPPYSSFGF